jgi:hypothetical protein
MRETIQSGYLGDDMTYLIEQMSGIPAPAHAGTATRA